MNLLIEAMKQLRHLSFEMYVLGFLRCPELRNLGLSMFSLLKIKASSYKLVIQKFKLKKTRN